MRMEMSGVRRHSFFLKRTGRSSLNWAAVVWFTGKQGFLLTDALICVFIVSVLAALCGAAVSTHYHAAEAIREEIREQEEEDERHLQEIGACELCQESPLPSETAGE